MSYQTGVAFIWTLAWLTGGFLFGFIFGIPKVIAATTSGTNPALNEPSQNSSPKLKVNTNLEDISDWLTKVLVGATLTQIVKIPAAIGQAAAFMGTNDVTNPLSFNAALLVYYCALGFLSGYILTRMFFARAFALADGNQNLSAEAFKSLDNARVGFGLSQSAVTADPNLRKAAYAADAVPITESLSSNQALNLAKGAILTGEDTRALAAAKLAVQKDPNDSQVQLAYAWAMYKNGSDFATVLPIMEGVAQKLVSSSDPAMLASAYASLAYLWLYQPPPAGYEHALVALDEYDRKGGAVDGDIEINRACAFGQKYTYLTDPKRKAAVSDTDQEEAKRVRDAALLSVKKAISADSSASSRLKELLWVTADSKDDDLAVFQQDQEFTVLLPRT